MPTSMRYYSAWKEFITRQEIPPGVPTIIAESWERCRLRISPLQSPTTSRLSSEHLLSTQVINFELLSIARPIMEDIHQYIEGSSSMVILANNAAYILDLVGDEDILQLACQVGIVPGTTLSEYHAGTNAVSLALLERIPVQVDGAGHYLKALHNFASAAAPIFDLSGTPLGALGILHFARDSHPHSLGVVVGGARAIEAQLQSDYLLAEQNSQLSKLNAILSTINEGILVWDDQGTIIHTNSIATEMLHLRVDRTLGHTITECMVFPAFIHEALKQQKTLSDVEASLEVQGQTLNCILSLRYIRSSRGLKGAIAILRHPDEVRRLVHQQLGSQASMTLSDLIGRTPALARARGIARSAAPARAPILIHGEPGTQKQTLAQAIHNYSPRASGPFITFDPTSLPNELILPDLVGVAIDQKAQPASGRPGKLEMADGGTLFIQHVEALPMEAQLALLNAIELGIVQRYGSKRAIDVSLRVIAASDEDLEVLVDQKRFNPELHFRLRSFEIVLPPLRERLDDLPLLIEDILLRLSRDRRRLVLTPQALNTLAAYPWPGNVRELEVALERAVAQAADSGWIDLEHLPKHLRQMPTHIDEPQELVPLQELQRSAIVNAARSCNGNVSQMARALGVGRTTIWRRMKQLDISPGDFRHNT